MAHILRCDECGFELDVTPRSMESLGEAEKRTQGWDRWRPWFGDEKGPRPDRCPECRERLGPEPIFDFAAAPTVRVWRPLADAEIIASNQALVDSFPPQFRHAAAALDPKQTIYS